jgi:DNA-directed RNA polymerase II subunit RPB2
MSKAAVPENILRGEAGRDMARSLLYKYFKTRESYLVRHQIDSFDQFLQRDLHHIIKAGNPIMLLKEQIGTTGVYEYKMEIFVGGENGDKLKIGTPTLTLQQGKEVRLLLPNEARLRNLTYQSLVTADILIRITFGGGPQTASVDPKMQEVVINDFPLFQIPILLHSRYCVLYKKPAEFLREAGECIYDQGGYFVVDGSEKVLITKQEQAFNTLYLKEQKRHPQVQYFASISCLHPVSRIVKRVTFFYLRREQTIQVGVPFVRKPIPLFVLFRAMGLTSDKEIMRTIFPDANAEDTKLMEPLLLPSIAEAYPFLDTYSAIQYIKTLTKGFSEAHVIDILRNQLFIHTSEKGNARIFFLAECVRNILKRVLNIDSDTDRDDTRYQRCLTAGFLTQMMFQSVYKNWSKAVAQTIDKEYSYNPTLYRGGNFINIFNPGNQNTILRVGQITEGIRRSFKGKWGTGMGEEKSGVLQALSRLSYMDFISHCRRAVLNFDTGMKAPEPRRLHGSQYGFFCTNETPGGASIGITKNLSILTTISTGTDPTEFITWMFKKGSVMPCNEIPLKNLPSYVPVYLNGGVLGFTQVPELLVQTLRLFKWTGALPAYSSVGFNYRDRRVFVFLDDGRPMRPLIHLGPKGEIPVAKLRDGRSWRELVMGDIVPDGIDIETPGFRDPLGEKEVATLEEYIERLAPHQGAIEYVDPYMQNEAFIASLPDSITAETTHLEVHPSTMVSMITGQIPFANHNQSVRNQLGDSQSKQGLSLYATNFQNRFDNTANILCYGEAPLVRTMYFDYMGDGNMPYGTNIILAMGSYTGYNQDDGILFNADSFQRGLFRNLTYRSYEAFEENDEMTHTRTRIAHPKSVAAWTDLKPGLDYTKLDDRGMIRIGEIVDENTVIVARYIQTESGQINDASLTPQVWTHGRVESVVVTVNNLGLLLVKIRVVQDRIPELGDKFSNRHGQKGTIGMMLRAQDMPRTASGLVPDMIMNPTAIPSRMTIAQLLEMLFGKAAALTGAIGNGTIFMNDGSPADAIGKVLQDQFGYEKLGNEYLYNGQTGKMMESYIFIGPVYGMRLKHMVEDKWNARGEGRRERRTHQPTGGRGKQGGLRIGELERDAICAHGITSFIRETYMKRSDGTEILVCNGCGTLPIYNERESLYICPLCEGPVKFVGETANNLEILPPTKRSIVTFSRVELPYACQLLNEELNTYMNIGMRYITSKYGTRLTLPAGLVVNKEEAMAKAKEALPERVLLETHVPKLAEGAPKLIDVTTEDLAALGAVASPDGEDEVQEEKEAAPVVSMQAQLMVPVATAMAAPALVSVPLRAAAASRAGIGLGPIEEEEAFPEAEELTGTVQPPPRRTAEAGLALAASPPSAPASFALGSAAVASSPTYVMSSGIPAMAFPQGYVPMQQQFTFAPVASPAVLPAQTLGLAPSSGPGILQVQAPATQLLPAAMGSAPATLVVDTGPEAMASAGLPAVPAVKRKAATGTSGPVVIRGKSQAARPGAAAGQGDPAPSSVRVNIIKQGSK